MEATAGAAARHCGYVADGSDAIDGAVQCVREAYSAGQAFTFAMGSDTTMWWAYTWDGKTNVLQIMTVGTTIVSEVRCAAFEVTTKTGLHCSM